MEERDLKYLKTMARQYPTIASAATEIINLQAILSLPKGTAVSYTHLTLPTTSRV